MDSDARELFGLDDLPPANMRPWTLEEVGYTFDAPHVYPDGRVEGGQHPPEYYAYDDEVFGGTWEEGLQAIEEFDWSGSGQLQHEQDGKDVGTWEDGLKEIESFDWGDRANASTPDGDQRDEKNPKDSNENATLQTEAANTNTQIEATPSECPKANTPCPSSGSVPMELTNTGIPQSRSPEYVSPTNTENAIGDDGDMPGSKKRSPTVVVSGGDHLRDHSRLQRHGDDSSKSANLNETNLSENNRLSNMDQEMTDLALEGDCTPVNFYSQSSSEQTSYPEMSVSTNGMIVLRYDRLKQRESLNLVGDEDDVVMEDQNDNTSTNVRLTSTDTEKLSTAHDQRMTVPRREDCVDLDIEMQQSLLGPSSTKVKRHNSMCDDFSNGTSHLDQQDPHTNTASTHPGEAEVAQHNYETDFASHAQPGAPNEIARPNHRFPDTKDLIESVVTPTVRSDSVKRDRRPTQRKVSESKKASLPAKKLKLEVPIENSTGQPDEVDALGSQSNLTKSSSFDKTENPTHVNPVLSVQESSVLHNDNISSRTRMSHEPGIPSRYLHSWSLNPSKEYQPAISSQYIQSPEPVVDKTPEKTKSPMSTSSQPPQLNPYNQATEPPPPQPTIQSQRSINKLERHPLDLGYGKRHTRSDSKYEAQKSSQGTNSSFLQAGAEDAHNDEYGPPVKQDIGKATKPKKSKVEVRVSAGSNGSTASANSIPASTATATQKSKRSLRSKTPPATPTLPTTAKTPPTKPRRPSTQTPKPLSISDTKPNPTTKSKSKQTTKSPSVDPDPDFSFANNRSVVLAATTPSTATFPPSTETVSTRQTRRSSAVQLECEKEKEKQENIKMRLRSRDSGDAGEE